MLDPYDEPNGVFYFMEQEIWKPVVGFEGLYEVSSKGVVKSIPRMIIRNKGSYFSKGKILSPYKDENGYLYVSLCKNGKPKSFFVHRLVALAFIPNPESKPHIDHINTITFDNRVENLRWCTPFENSNNPITLERVRINGHSVETTKKNMASRKNNHKYNAPKRVFQYTIDGNLIATYESISEARKITGIENIGCVTRGERNKAGGYKWKLEKIEPIFQGSISSKDAQPIQLTLW